MLHDALLKTCEVLASKQIQTKKKILLKPDRYSAKQNKGLLLLELCFSILDGNRSHVSVEVPLRPATSKR